MGYWRGGRNYITEIIAEPLKLQAMAMHIISNTKPQSYRTSFIPKMWLYRSEVLEFLIT